MTPGPGVTQSSSELQQELVSSMETLLQLTSVFHITGAKHTGVCLVAPTGNVILAFHSQEPLHLSCQDLGFF